MFALSVQAARQRRRTLSASNGALSDVSDGTAAHTASTAAAGQAEQTGAKSGGKQKGPNWLKHRLFNMSRGSLKNMEDDESDATSRASSAADLQVNSHTFCCNTAQLLVSHW